MRNSDQSKFPNLGDMDNQLKTANHDEIVMWMYEKLKNRDYIMDILDLKDKHVKNMDLHIEPRLPLCKYKAFYIDLLFCYTIEEVSEYKNDVRKKAFFEIKTSVNMGETIRQINHARHSRDPNGFQGYGIDPKNHSWFVVAPMFSHYHILEEQGIRFIPYEP